MAWLIGWYRRKSKLVRGSTAGGQTNYQLKLTIYKGSGIDTDNTIYLGGHVNNDFSDLRFTSSDETTLLPYWIESYISGVSAIVWIKIDSIPADPFSKTIYVYYDNSIATIVSNGATTFELFDDFNNETVGSPPVGWTITQAGGSYVRIYNANSVQLYGDGSNDAYMEKNFTLPTNFVYETRAYNPAINSLPQPIILLDKTNNRLLFSQIERSGWDPIGRIHFSFGNLPDVAYIIGWNNWHTYRFHVLGNFCDTYIDETLIWTNKDMSATMSVDKIKMLMRGYMAVGWFLTDYVRIRKYTSPEPTWSTTSPEQIYTASLAISSIPSGAKIYINNQDYSIYTDTSVVLNPGTYTILLTKAGYQDYIQIIVLSPNQNAIVQGNLILTTGNLDISSTPSGAEIFLAPTGSPLIDQVIVTPNTISLSPLTYDYKLTHIDYYDATGSFTITSGLTITLNILLTHLPCPTTTKNIGDILTLNATPIQGVAPYTVEFRRANSENMVNIIDTTNVNSETYLIPTGRLGGLSNPVYDVTEGIMTTRLYTIEITDINDATSKAPGEGSSLLFATKMIDSCTPSQSCVKYCKIFVTCSVPVCDFVVT